MKRVLVHRLFVLLVTGMTTLSVSAQAPVIPITPQPDGRLCWSYAEAQQPLEETFEEFITGAGRGRGVFTYYELRTLDSRRLDLLGFGVYEAAQGTEVSLHLELYSPEDETQSIRYLFLVNEEQIALNTEGEEEFYLDVRLKSHEIAAYDILLPRFDTGIYDIVILALTDFDSEPEPIGRPGESHHRMTLLVGQSSDVRLPYRHLEAMGPLLSVPQLLSLTFGDSLVQWSYPEPAYQMAANQELQFNVLVSYAGQSDFGNGLPDPVVSQFALIVFLDYIQAGAFDGEDILYGEVDLNTTNSRVQVVLPEIATTGLHEVLVVRINNPRRPICILQGPEGGYWLPFDAIHIRAALEVLGK